jgi:pilin isopeptide linkage protein
VTVEDSGLGKLVAKVTYDKAAGIGFVNTTGSTTPPTPTPTSTKTGFEFNKNSFGRSEGFDFKMTAADAQGNPRAGANTDYTGNATIADDGSQAFTTTVQNGQFAGDVSQVVFPEIEYTADGDYYYLIEENESSDASMIADGAQYLAHVVVSNGEAASTTYELLYEGSNLGKTDDLSFYNNSEVTLGFNSLPMMGNTPLDERVSVYPKAKKYLNDSTDQLVGGEFTFELIDEMTGSVLAVATNDEVGNIAFFDEDTDPGLVYDEPGVFRYTMREVAGNEADMIYDSSAISMTVVVTQTDEDGLAVDVSYNGPGGGEPAFYNVKRGMDVKVQKVSRYGGEGLANCTYALWMVGENGDALVQEAVSDANGYITFKNVTLLAGQKYYFKEVEAPKGHTVDPYRTAYFTLNEAGDALVLIESTAADGWHPATEK